MIQHLRAKRLAAALIAPLLLSAAASTCGSTVEAHGYCARTCATAADCCNPGVPGCPGDYPENFACEHGLCLAPRCQKDADCNLGMSTPTLGCRAVTGRNGCVLLCARDADCTSPFAPTCTGQTDDGTRICGGEPDACKSDQDCFGGLHCQDGLCRCETDADCGDSKLHCQEGRCGGCRSDAECGPNLDACTDDPAFAYPPSATAGKK